MSSKLDVSRTYLLTLLLVLQALRELFADKFVGIQYINMDCKESSGFSQELLTVRFECMLCAPQAGLASNVAYGSTRFIFVKEKTDLIPDVLKLSYDELLDPNTSRSTVVAWSVVQMPGMTFLLRRDP